MKRFFMILGCCSAVCLLSQMLPAESYGYGEGADIPMEARAIHVLTNEARSNPEQALKQCGDYCKEGIACYTTAAPLYWRNDLGNAAQFHASMMAYTHCFAHNSACKLKSNVFASFPSACDGNPTCACDGGSATCNDNNNTQTFDRVRGFTALANVTDKAFGENIAAYYNGARMAFYGWIWEDGGNPNSCEWTASNGHRSSIFSHNFQTIGVGVKDKYYVQDFGSAVTDSYPLTSGAYYASGDAALGDIFKTHYYAPSNKNNAALTNAVLAINHTCHTLELTYGSPTNGSYTITGLGAIPDCTPFVFEAVDQSGQTYRYPTTGALLYHCNERSWQSDTLDQTCLKKEDNSGDNPGDNTGGNSGDNTGDNSGDNSGDNTGDNSGDNTGDNSGDNTGDNSGDNTGGNSGGNSGDNSGDNSGGNSGDNSGGNSGDNSSNNDGDNAETEDGNVLDSDDSCSSRPLMPTSSPLAMLLIMMLSFAGVFSLRRRQPHPEKTDMD